MKKIVIMSLIAISLAGCGKQHYVVSTPGEEEGSRHVVVGYPKVQQPASTTPERVKLPQRGGNELRQSAFLPNATAFRMNGDYADNVAVNVDNKGDLTYFPAPSDITAYSEPVALGDGWWLNNQGLGPNSVFTTYTFAKYSALPSTPSIQQIKQSIIPGAKVTEIIELPLKIGEANNNIEYLKEYIKSL